MSISTSQLSANIIEICHALDQEPKHQIIVAGGSIWDAELGVGLLLSRGVRVLRFVGVDHQASSKREACKATYTSFQSYLDATLDTMILFARIIVTGSKDSLSQIQYQAQIKPRKELYTWERNIGCFFRLPSAHEDLTNLYSFLKVESQLDFDLPKTVSRTLQIIKKTKQYRYFLRMINLLNYDGVIDGQFPFKAIEQCMLGKALTHEESLEIKVLARRLNIFDEITLQELWMGLKVMFDLNERYQECSGRSILRVAEALEKEGVSIFLRRDTASKEWLKDLLRGERKEVEVNGKVYELSGAISLPRPGEDQRVVFSIKNEKKWMYICSGYNPFVLMREFDIQQEKDVGIPLQKILHIDESGLGAVIERLSESLDSCSWPEDSSLFEVVDKKRLKAVAYWIQYCIKNKFTPSPLNPAHIMFSFEDSLCLLKPVEKEKFDYLALEKLIWTVAAGSDYVYEYLLKESTLSTCSLNEFYFESMFAKIEGRPFDIVQEALHRGIKDDPLVKQAQILQTHAIRARDDVLAMHLARGNLVSTEMVNKIFQELYISKNYTIRIPASFKRALFNSTLKSMHV